jgi:predicted transcriptional regulator of viral defense system
LTQDALNRAFAREQRRSNLVFTNGAISVTIVAGKSTQKLGVEQIPDSNGQTFEATNLERTLIDIAVRPAYAGGIAEVLRAYRAARNRASVDRLLSLLDALDHVYPYHQAIGFLMERAGYNSDVCAKLAARGLKHDFYLAHGMEKPGYSKSWRLYYPQDLKVSHTRGRNER